MLAQDAGDGPSRGDQHERSVQAVRHMNTLGHRPGKHPSDDVQQCRLVQPALVPGPKPGVVFDDAV